jgi:hypothetical protein
MTSGQPVDCQEGGASRSPKVQPLRVHRSIMAPTGGGQAFRKIWCWFRLLKRQVGFARLSG